ncbi:MAG TPA: hypothetical protein DIW61_03735 [Candidatus Aminicenantes bacterium]|nr:hypothetical protein [Candidatus Aminicenantes bacterium]
MPNQNLTNRSALIIFLLSAVLLSLSPRFAESTETREWSLRAPAEKAIARLNPEADMTWISAGSIVPQMMEKMMFGGPDIREGKKGEKYGAFFGLKISLKLKGGWNIFSGADLDPGSGGLYDRAIDDLTSRGVTVIRNEKRSNHAGFEAGGDLIYSITPRFGIGVGAGSVHTKRGSLMVYGGQDMWDDFLRAAPLFETRSLRLAAFTTFPLSSLLAISVNGGPALFSAEYKFSMGITSQLAEMGYYDLFLKEFYQEAKARRLGLEGGIGFEFTANPFTVFFLEAVGRYGQISGFKGREKTVFFQKGVLLTSTKEGDLYFIQTEKSPVLEISAGEPSGALSARKATFNVSGVSLFAGLKLRF